MERPRPILSKPPGAKDRQEPAPAKTRSSGKYTALRKAPVLPPPAHFNQTAMPQRPGDSGPMSKAEFYLYCKRTGQLALFFAMYPGG